MQGVVSISDDPASDRTREQPIENEMCSPKISLHIQQFVFRSTIFTIHLEP